MQQMLHKNEMITSNNKYVRQYFVQNVLASHCLTFLMRQKPFSNAEMLPLNIGHTLWHRGNGLYPQKISRNKFHFLTVILFVHFFFIFLFCSFRLLFRLHNTTGEWGICHPLRCYNGASIKKDIHRVNRHNGEMCACKMQTVKLNEKIPVKECFAWAKES